MDRIQGAAPRPVEEVTEARIGGFDLHASAPISRKRRDRLEKLLGYLLRPPLAKDRLRLTDDGHVLLKLKTSWRDGTTHLKLTGSELLARLSALVCKPHKNQILYSGVLAANSKWRSRIVPPPSEEDTSEPGCCEGKGSITTSEGAETPPPRRRNPSWAELMQRGLEIDVLACPKCGDRFRYVATIMTREAIRRILTHLDLPSEPPELTPERPVIECDEIAWA